MTGIGSVASLSAGACGVDSAAPPSAQQMREFRFHDGATIQFISPYLYLPAPNPNNMRGRRWRRTERQGSG